MLTLMYIEITKSIVKLVARIYTDNICDLVNHHLKPGYLYQNN